jgi:hypothetical protein
MKKVILTLFVCSLLINLKGQTDCNICESALKLDLMYYNFTSSEYLNFLNIITEENYSSFRQDASIKYRVIIPEFSEMLSGSLNYKDFNEKRASIFKKMEFVNTRETSIRILSLTISKDGYSSFDNCSNVCAKKLSINAIVEEATDNWVRVRIEYSAPIGTREPMIIESSEIFGGTYNNSNQLFNTGDKFQPGSSKIFIIKRSYNSEVYGVINATHNGTYYSTSYRVRAIHIPQKDTLSEILIVKTMESCNLNECMGYKNIISVNYLETLTREDGDCPHGCLLINPSLRFGTWSNPQCGVNNTMNGWYTPSIGTCGTGQGEGIKGCQWVKVLLKYTVIR